MITLNPHRSLRLFLASAALLGAGLVSGLAAATPTASQVVIKDVTFRGAAGSTVKAVKAAGLDAVMVDGATVVIDFAKIVEKAAGKAALSSCTFLVRTLDSQAHRLSVGLGKLGAVNLTIGDADAWLLPNFTGAKTFSVQVFDKGKLTKSASSQKTTFTLEDFDVVHDGTVDDLSFDLTYGKVQKEAWSVTLTHGETTVVLTPEGVTEKLTDGPTQLAVQTTGVGEGFVIVREGVTVSPL